MYGPYTQAHSVHRNTGKGTASQPLGRRALECTVTGVPANAFTININSTNKNTLIKAYFLLKTGNLISRARKIVTKFHNYSYEIVMSPVIVNSYKNGHNSYQIVK